MSFDQFLPESGLSEPSYLDSFLSRGEIIGKLKKQPWFDCVIVGGGIHGANFARLAALNGLKTLLLERDDYAQATSSRSSKMAHGGLRYLEMFDFRQVFEGLRARNDLLESAAHLVKKQKFLIPVYAQQKFLKFKLRLGLLLYDRLQSSADKHHWRNKDEFEQIFKADLLGGFEYTDALMNDTRLVIENIIAARQEGAQCLNYAEVLSLKHRTDSRVEVGWLDKLSRERHQINCGIVINCAGPWVPFVGRIINREQNLVRYSQGIHLLFKVPWKDKAILLPTSKAGVYYFVWPHFSGALVGTTEREVSDLERDPIPTTEEVNELLARLSQDLPHSGLTRENLFYCYAGVRTLALRPGSKDTSQLSRRHIWNYANGMLSLIGGKFTTASLTAAQGLKIAMKLSGQTKNLTDLKGRKLPGAALYEESVRDFTERCLSSGINQEIVQGTIRRLGSRVRYLLDKDEYLEVLAGRVFKGEIELGLKVEQAETLEDIMRRRLDLEFTHDYGFEAIKPILEVMRQTKPELNAESEENNYRKRIENLRSIMGLT